MNALLFPVKLLPDSKEKSSQPEGETVPAEMPPEDFMSEPTAPVPNMSGEAPVEPATTPAEVPPAEVPPAEVPPAEVPPAEVPPAEVPPAGMISDERLKNIKAGRAIVSKFLNKKKEPNSMKLNTSIISACGGN